MIVELFLVLNKHSLLLRSYGRNAESSIAILLYFDKGFPLLFFLCIFALKNVLCKTMKCPQRNVRSQGFCILSAQWCSRHLALLYM